jgi:hypothetical protein
MSYLSQPTSKTEYGIVQVGNHIDVDADGIISLAQDVSPTAAVHFASVESSTMVQDGKIVVSSVIPTAGPGISLQDIETDGPETSFTINNSGVISLTAGTGISLSASSGAVTVSSTGTSTINTTVVTTSYTATATDQYIGVNSTTAVDVSLPAGVTGRTYIIKDERGQGSGKISIKPAAPELIDGAAAYIIRVPYASIQVVFRGGQWRII